MDSENQNSRHEAWFSFWWDSARLEVKDAALALGGLEGSEIPWSAPLEWRALMEYQRRCARDGVRKLVEVAHTRLVSCPVSPKKPGEVKP